MKKKWLFFLLMIAALLSGCNRNAPINEHSQGVWDHYFVYPMSKLLLTLGHLFSGNYGLAIIALTLIIRFCLLPLMLRQFKTAVAMQKLRPEMQKLQEKYKGTDVETQRKLQQEMMMLYQKHGVNPMSGCLPALIQMPIFMALYYAIRRTEEIKLHSFLWVQLGHRDPYFILPVLAAVTTFISMRLSPSMSEQQMSQMAIMSYIMPVMIFMGASSVPSALSLYWVVGGCFSIIQSLILRTQLKSAKIAENGQAS
ncbi:membrane protein insertase YidC [Anoxybacteroides tepidamans]|uniref:membrane protein insertase YidC n=1 Tax=Anoxybacteroides tepidamans TaxID=265948 RepID=UPI0004889FC3|nr:membrane protein insertase YidC [Anoxybacillus tepidamans]